MFERFFWVIWLFKALSFLPTFALQTWIMAKLRQIIEGDSPVLIGTEALGMLNELLKQFEGRKKFLLVDENTHQHCFPTVSMSVAELENAHLVEFPGG